MLFRSRTSSVDGFAWDRWEGDRRRSLVRIEGGVVTIVTGTADWPVLESLAGSLTPVPQAP